MSLVIVTSSLTDVVALISDANAIILFLSGLVGRFYEQSFSLHHGNKAYLDQFVITPLFVWLAQAA